MIRYNAEPLTSEDAAIIDRLPYKAAHQYMVRDFYEAEDFKFYYKRPTDRLQDDRFHRMCLATRGMTHEQRVAFLIWDNGRVDVANAQARLQKAEEALA